MVLDVIYHHFVMKIYYFHLIEIEDGIMDVINGYLIGKLLLYITFVYVVLGGTLKRAPLVVDIFYIYNYAIGMSIIIIIFVFCFFLGAAMISFISII